MTTPTNPPTGPEREPATHKTSLRYGEPAAPTVQPEQESDGKDRARSVLEALNVPTHPTPATATSLELLTPVERLALELSEMEPEGLMRANNHLRAKNERLERELQAAHLRADCLATDVKVWAKAHAETLAKQRVTDAERSGWMP
jgi:hypothetical protein